MLVSKTIRISVLFYLVVLFSGCSSFSISAPKIPENLNKPSAVTRTKINGVKIGLPAGWVKVEKIPKNYKQPGGIVYLKHSKYGKIIIFKSPMMADARYGQIFTRTLKNTAMPDSTLYAGSMSLKNNAIIEVYKGTVVLGGERFPMKYYEAYNIRGGKYLMHASVADTPSKTDFFYDFIAIAGSM